MLSLSSVLFLLPLSVAHFLSVVQYFYVLEEKKKPNRKPLTCEQTGLVWRWGGQGGWCPPHLCPDQVCKGFFYFFLVFRKHLRHLFVSAACCRPFSRTHTQHTHTHTNTRTCTPTHSCGDCILAGKPMGDNHTRTPFLINFPRGGSEDAAGNDTHTHAHTATAITSVVISVSSERLHFSRKMILYTFFFFSVLFCEAVFAVSGTCGARQTFQKLLEAEEPTVAHCKTSRTFRLIPKASRLRTNNSHFLLPSLNLTDGPKWLVRPVQTCARGFWPFFFLFFLSFLLLLRFPQGPSSLQFLSSSRQRADPRFSRRHCNMAPLSKDKIMKPSKVTAVSLQQVSSAVKKNKTSLHVSWCGCTLEMGSFFFPTKEEERTIRMVCHQSSNSRYTSTKTQQ